MTGISKINRGSYTFPNPPVISHLPTSPSILTVQPHRKKQGCPAAQLFRKIGKQETHGGKNGKNRNFFSKIGESIHFDGQRYIVAFTLAIPIHHFSPSTVIQMYILSNRALFHVYIASSKHKKGWENSPSPPSV